MDHYEGVAGEELADAFYWEFINLARRAADNPESFGMREQGLLRANLPRFPNNFLFRVDDANVRILVLRHHARHPS